MAYGMAARSCSSSPYTRPLFCNSKASSDVCYSSSSTLYRLSYCRLLPSTACGGSPVQGLRIGLSLLLEEAALALRRRPSLKGRSRNRWRFPPQAGTGLPCLPRGRSMARRF